MLNNIQKYQYEFLKQNPIIRNAGPWGCEYFEHNFKFALDNFSKFTILCPQEVFSDLDYVNNLQSIIKSNPDKEIYISCSTTSKYEYSLDPLLNILFWRDTYSRNEIAWESGDIPIFDESNYTLSKKDNKFILSSRKQRKRRDYIFDKISHIKPEGIVRYAKWPEQGHEDRRWEIRNKYKFPNWIDIIKEYNRSFFSFVIESDASSFVNQISEKSFLPFLTKCIPIILPNETNLVSEIKDMGFYIFNEEFGVNDTSDEITNLNSFANAVIEINKMNINEVENFYNKNIDKIEHNYKLIRFLLMGDSLVEHKLKKYSLL